MSLSITVFSDFACPYSYVTESALWSLDIDEIEISYRAYELFPEPAQLASIGIAGEEHTTLERLATFQGISLASPPIPARTRKAHEVSRFAREKGIEQEVRKGIYRGVWEEGRDIGRIDVLIEIATTAGADPEDLKIALDIDRFGDEILHDLEMARRLRVPGTPTIFIGTGHGARVLAGAHGPAVLRTTIEDALREMKPTEDDV